MKEKVEKLSSKENVSRAIQQKSNSRGISIEDNRCNVLQGVLIVKNPSNPVAKPVIYDGSKGIGGLFKKKIDYKPFKEAISSVFEVEQRTITDNLVHKYINKALAYGDDVELCVKIPTKSNETEFLELIKGVWESKKDVIATSFLAEADATWLLKVTKRDDSDSHLIEYGPNKIYIDGDEYLSNSLRKLFVVKSFHQSRHVRGSYGDCYLHDYSANQLIGLIKMEDIDGVDAYQVCATGHVTDGKHVFKAV